MMASSSSNTETLLEGPNPPQKKTKALNLEQDEETWYKCMSMAKERNLMHAVYDNAMNSLIEGSGPMGQVAVEDEAVSMAIRCHGLAYVNEVIREEENWNGEVPSTSGAAPPGLCSTSTEDLLSHAVSAAIKKKGLGAVDR